MFPQWIIIFFFCSPCFVWGNAQTFVNQNVPESQFQETVEKIKKTLEQFAKNGIRLPETLIFSIVLTSLYWEEETSKIVIAVTDPGWLIERKITRRVRPILEDKSYRLELDGVSLDEFLQQKKRLESAVKSWKRAGASLKSSTPVRFTSAINFHTIQEKVICVSISLENEEDLERILSLFFSFSFQMPEVTLQVKNVSVNEFKKARATVKEWSARQKKENQKVPAFLVAQHTRHPFFYRSDYFVFPWNTSLTLLEKNWQSLISPPLSPVASAPEKQKNIAPIVPKDIPLKNLSKNPSENPLKDSSSKKATLKLSSTVINELMHQLYQPDISLQLNAIQAFATYGEQSAVMVPNLLGFLRSPAPEIRLATIQTMGAIGTSAILAVPVLLLNLDDPSPIIRENVALTLGAIQSPESLSFLKLQLKREKEETVRQALTSAIQQIQSLMIPSKNF